MKESDCSFVLSCTVRNQYNRKRQLKCDWTKLPATDQEFLAKYGDTFISDVIEGGEFVAAVSATAKESSKIEKVKTELSVALSMVSGGGRGGYDSTTLNSLAKTEVTVRYSGASGVNSSKFSTAFPLPDMGGGL